VLKGGENLLARGRNTGKNFALTLFISRGTAANFANCFQLFLNTCFGMIIKARNF
jgi:hypothetical protein